LVQHFTWHLNVYKIIAPDIFYVEDDPDFGFFMRQAVLKVDKTISVKIIVNGRDAMIALTDIIKANEKPHLILLDFNLPGLSGLELVKLIRLIPFLDSVPVVIFSTATNPKDIKMCIKAGANDYIIKVAGYTNLVGTVKGICERWIGINAAVK
jgi:DNA-binding response OmpR family regulator